MTHPNPPGEVDTNTSGSSQRSGSAAAPDPRDPREVLIETERSLTEAIRDLRNEVRIGGIRAAAASGDPLARTQWENLQHQNLGGGADLYGGINPTAGQTKTTGGGAGGGPAAPDGGPAPGGDGYRYSGPRTLSQVRASATQRLGQRIATNRGAHAAPPGGMRQALGRTIGQSGGTMGGLMQAARQELPGVGVAIDVGEAAYETAERVRDAGVAGRQYEAIEGPMGEIAQQKERMNAWGWSHTQAGWLEGGETAQQQFNTATQLGFRGDRRSALLGQMYHLTMSTGMTGEEESSLMQDVVKNANSNLSQLTDAIEGVSNAAKNAGVNAQVARKRFEDSFENMTRMGFGSAAGGIAGGLAQAITNMGPSMQGTNLQVSETDMYRFAGMAGMTPSQFISQNQRTGGVTLARTMDASQLQMIQGVLGPAYQQIQQMIARAPGGGQGVRQNPSAAAAIAQQAIPLVPNVLMLTQWAATNLGLQNADPMQVMTYIVQFMSGNTPGSNIQSQQRSMQTTGLNPGGGAKVGTGGLIDFGKSMSDYQHASGAAGATGGLSSKQMSLNSLMDKAGDLQQHGHWYSVGDHTNQTAQGVVKGELAKGRRDPIIEGLLQNVQGLDKQLMIVNTNQGQKVVTARVAMMDYPDQVRSGQATFYAEGKVNGDHVEVSGKSQYAGQGVSQILGYQDDTSKTKQAAAREGSLTNPTHGIKASDASRQLDEKTGGKSGQVTTFDLTPAAKAVLTPLVGGNASQVSTSAAYGAPPSNDYANAASSPGRTY